MFWQNSNTSRILENVSEVNNVTRSSIENILNSIVERLPYIVAGLIVLLIFWLLSKILKAIFWSASQRLDARLRVLFSRLITVGVVLLGVFTALTVIIPTLRFGDLITGLGFTSFVIGFATKDILNNLLSGVLILWHQPFRIGDYIFIGSNQGKVEDIGVRATQLRKDDGELVLVPNGELYTNALTIRGAGSERRMKLDISIGYDSDIDDAKRLIENVLRRAAGVIAEPQPHVVVTDLSSAGVDLSIYFWINTDQHPPQEATDEVAAGIKKELGNAGVEIYPANSNAAEKPAADPSPAVAPEDTAKRKKEAEEF